MKNKSWTRNPIDQFVLAKLETKGFAPAKEADKRTLLRRVTFDLIGLPPTPSEIAAFLADKSPNAYEKAVDRLLASPHYGERSGRRWLDLVRFAETDGHEFDFDKPDAWQYRDYVIRALNADLPYNQFVTEHLAGDLIAKPRLNPNEGFNESILGTGFFWFGEGKHSPVELEADEAERIDNQVDVLSRAFLGLSMGCARCHNHKFDAISTKDYYALAGYLKSSRFHLATLLPEMKTQPILRRLEAISGLANDTLLARTKATLAGQISSASVLPAPEKNPETRTRLASNAPKPAQKSAWTEFLQGEARRNPNDLFHPLAVLSEGAQSGEAFQNRKRSLIEELHAQDKKANEEARKATVFADFSQESFKNWFVSGEAFGKAPRPACLIAKKDSALELKEISGRCADSGAISDKLEGALRSKTFVISKKRIAFHVGGRDCEINLVIDGFQRIRFPIYGGLKIPVNSPNELIWTQMDVEKWIGHKAYVEALDPGNGRITLDKIVFFDANQPEPRPNPLLIKLLEDPKIDSVEALSDGYRALLKDSLKLCSGAPPQMPQGELAFTNWMLKTGRRIAAPAVPALPASKQKTVVETPLILTEDQKLKAEIEALIPAPQHAMTLIEGAPEDDRVHIRGSFKTLGDSVPRRFLEAIDGVNQPAPSNGSGRLELAKRMVAPKNPLFARVIVNRLWQQHFGEGIVRTPDDFGVMGEAPTHPELLDWLASNFIGAAEKGVLRPYSLKSLHRLMVTSSAYRMSSQIESPKIEERDPLNKWLHRMPVKRLEAEAIRDSVLAVSGRLDAKLYGASVLPNLSEFMQGRGRPTSGPLDGDGRRSIYVSVRRNFLTPLFLAFDYPVPFNAIGRRTVSNVPAQALALMNNPFILQQAELWAKKTLAEPAKTSEGRISGLYESAFGRLPEPSETADALSFLNATLTTPGSPEELRSWSDLCHVLFNVKEFIFVR